ncbi:MAG: metallophosphoesterase, partial [Actinomycetota bacterium]|nr:metallophosphoesterase [Actinomycetota bacterium]
MLLAVIVTVLGIGLVAVLYAVFVERRWYRVGRYRIDILPAGGSALRVLHLSDLHLTDGDRRAERFVSSLPHADVTVVTGDIVGEPEAVEFAASVLRPARGRLASLFVLGSNDL